MRWGEALPSFIKVMPRDYKRALNAVSHLESTTGLRGEDLVMAAFRLSQQRLEKALFTPTIAATAD